MIYLFIYLRCKDHQPSDGLGAHRLILAAASSRLKEILLEVSSAEDELICLHLPDYTSVEVGPVMSLLYYGETWITESCAQVCQDILQVNKLCSVLLFLGHGSKGHQETTSAHFSDFMNFI